ncbi:MAG: NUDIX hydrolase [Thiobacillus sp.]|nr:NUDIX hydrolase [Thiobacillus sp.]
MKDVSKFLGDWTLTNELVRVSSRWVTLVGERWICDKGKELEYWRVEKVDSVIVLPIHRGQLLTAKPTFRPGVCRHTLDFPGGRLPEGKAPADIVPLLLERELGVPAHAVRQVQALNATKWDINSSFSNQGLWAFSAHIDDACDVPETLIGLRASADADGVRALLGKLDCLQCRAVLTEWHLGRSSDGA